ncbi:uncharacterized protein LOC142628941 [Castanea sativa]|uniref:uncharacterized protein LOC142628941 n=1 Tax=Castanea sativa TaxID=21020 RepID=UPI003F65232B
MQKEINHLKKKLRCERRMRTPSFSDPSFEDSQGSGYRSRSRAPPDHLHGHQGRESSSKGLGNDAKSRALHQISKLPFMHRVEKGKLPRWFTQPTFTIYNGRIDHVKHVSHFNQKMAVHSKNETLTCKVFPSSWGLVAMRWFNGLKAAIQTFKVGLPIKHDLRKSLTKKPVRSVRRLMDRIDEYKQVEEDQQQGKGKVKVIPQERRDFRLDKYNNNRPRRDFAGQSLPAIPQVVNIVFREPMHQVLEKIRNEPYFKWPNKMFVKEGRLKQFLYHPNGQGGHSGSVNQGNNSSRPPLGTINVILAALGRTGSCLTRVMFVSRTLAEESNSEPKRIKGNTPPILGFSEEDKIGTIQPHDDALVVTLRIGGYDMRRVMVDQGSGANIMYPDLFRGLNLKLEDLTAYNSPLISFEGKVVIPKGQIRLPVQSGLEFVDVDFIVVDTYSPYTAIVAKLGCML